HPCTAEDDRKGSDHDSETDCCPAASRASEAVEVPGGSLLHSLSSDRHEMAGSAHRSSAPAPTGEIQGKVCSAAADNREICSGLCLDFCQDPLLTSPVSLPQAERHDRLLPVQSATAFVSHRLYRFVPSSRFVLFYRFFLFERFLLSYHFRLFFSFPPIDSHSLSVLFSPTPAVLISSTLPLYFPHCLSPGIPCSAGRQDFLAPALPFLPFFPDPLLLSSSVPLPPPVSAAILQTIPDGAARRPTGSQTAFHRRCKEEARPADPSGMDCFLSAVPENSPAPARLPGRKAIPLQKRPADGPFL